MALDKTGEYEEYLRDLSRYSWPKKVQKKTSKPVVEKSNPSPISLDFCIWLQKTLTHCSKTIRTILTTVYNQRNLYSHLN